MSIVSIIFCYKRSEEKSCTRNNHPWYFHYKVLKLMELFFHTTLYLFKFILCLQNDLPKFKMGGGGVQTCFSIFDFFDFFFFFYIWWYIDGFSFFFFFCVRNIFMVKCFKFRFRACVRASVENFFLLPFSTSNAFPKNCDNLFFSCIFSFGFFFFF